MTTTLVCPACNKNNTWNNNRYKQGLIFKCTSCSIQLQQVFCPHCSKSNTWTKPERTIEGQKLRCGSCSKSFQYICCPYCQNLNIWSAADYEEGLVYNCYSCKKPFQSVFCPHCNEFNMFSTGESIQGRVTKCCSCAKTHQYIRCPHCQTGQIWKNSDYTPGSVVPCWSCKQNYAYMRCPHCKKSNYWKDVLNTTLTFTCYSCKKDMCATGSPSKSLERAKSDLRRDRDSSQAPLDRVERGLSSLNLNRSKARSTSVAPKSREKHRSDSNSGATDRSRKTIDCGYYAECKEFVKFLKWPLPFFDKKHDRCYCGNCYPKHYSDTLRVADADYVVPRGWAGFGLGVDPFRADNIWNTWIAVYHGTSAIAAQSILHHRQFLLPGDHLIDGTQLAIRPGHIPGKVHIYTSPSIRYSSLEVYSTKCPFTSRRTGKHYSAQIVLQCKQKPGTFETQSETVGWGDKPICHFIPNDRIEHFTDRRSTIIPYRLLIRLKDA